MLQIQCWSLHRWILACARPSPEPPICSLHCPPHTHIPPNTGPLISLILASNTALYSGPLFCVHAYSRYVASLYYKTVGDYAQFYRSALTYLSFVSSDTLPADFKLQLAVDVSLAALLGEHVYSFGQVNTEQLLR